jgi:hypothetical protein
MKLEGDFVLARVALVDVAERNLEGVVVAGLERVEPITFEMFLN